MLLMEKLENSNNQNSRSASVGHVFEIKNQSFEKKPKSFKSKSASRANSVNTNQNGIN